MPINVYTQTFLVTLNDQDEDLFGLLAGALEHTGNSYASSADFSYDIEEHGERLVADTRPTEEEEEELAAEKEAAERDKKLRARNAQLLELKGWLYGENEKKKADLPSEWDQSAWGRETTCGTSCCIAGKVVLEAGGKFVGGVEREGVRTFERAFMPDGSYVYVSDMARDILDLDSDQRSALFAGGNRYEHAAAIIDAIILGVTGPGIWSVRDDADRRANFG